MKILVTGSGGLIGGYLASFFTQQGAEVIAGYRNTPPNIKGSSANNVRHLQLDVSEPLYDLESVDVVIHAAAHTHLVPDSTTEQYVKANVTGALNLARYAKRTKPSLFIYLSTISMFGEVQVTELLEDTPVHRPGTYGMTKYLGEQIFQDHSDEFPSVSIRLPGVVGPGYFTPWIGSVLTKASKDEDIAIYNPGNLFNNIVDLEELARFISHVINVGSNGFEAVNLASKDPITTRKVVDTIISLIGSHSKISSRQVDRASFFINWQKVVETYGFAPSSTKSVINRYVTENLGQLDRHQAVHYPI